MALVDETVVIKLSLRNLPGPLVAVADVDGHGESGGETAALGLGLAYDRLVPALVVIPVETFAPEVDAAIQLDLGQQVGAGLGAVVC